MAVQCPSNQQPNDLGCGVLRCCDDAGCDVNVQGPCVCATYGDPSPSQPGWNYSFMAQCSQNSVTGTPLGTGCTTIFGVEYAYSCYCRLTIPGDEGQVGDQVPGNTIFDTNDQRTVFTANNASSTIVPSPTSSPSSSPSGQATRSSRVEGLLGLCLLLLLLIGRL
jgi:hypothetical protein